VKVRTGALLNMRTGAATVSRFREHDSRERSGNRSHIEGTPIAQFRNRSFFLLSVRGGDGQQTVIGARRMRQNSFSPQSPFRLISCLAAFLIVAAPLAMVAWHELSEVLNGRFERGLLLRGFAAAFAFAGVALVLARLMKGVAR
jgi:hypothetical protein